MRVQESLALVAGLQFGISRSLDYHVSALRRREAAHAQHGGIRRPRSSVAHGGIVAMIHVLPVVRAGDSLFLVTGSR